DEITQRFGYEFAQAVRNGDPQSWLNAAKASVSTTSRHYAEIRFLLYSPKLAELVQKLQGQNGFVDDFAQALEGAKTGGDFDVEAIIARYRLADDNPLTLMARAAQAQYASARAAGGPSPGGGTTGAHAGGGGMGGTGGST